MAHALGALPLVDEALRRNEISYSKARALTRVATPETEQKLLTLAIHSTAQQLEKICRAYRRAATPEVVMAERWVRQQFVSNGLVRITAQLTAEEGAIVMKALSAAREALGLGEAEQRKGVLLSRPDAATGRAGAGPGESGGLADRPPTTAHLSAESAGDDREVGPSPIEARSAAPAVETAEQHAARQRHAEYLEWMDEMDAEGWGLEDDRGDADRNDAEMEGADCEETLPPPASATTAPDDSRARWAPPADALVFMAERFLAGGAGQVRVRGDRFTVMVHLDSKAIENGAPGVSLGDGSALSAESFRRLACDAGIVPVLQGSDGKTLDIGRKARAIPPSIQRALRKRDAGCRFPGCTNEVYVHAHHLHHWMEGGVTRMSNLVTLCSRHHRLVHEGGFAVEVVADEVRFKAPDGRAVPAVPTRPVEVGDLPRRETPWPRWDGTRLDMAEVSRALFG